jgi:hypothetical protein
MFFKKSQSILLLILTSSTKPQKSASITKDWESELKAAAECHESYFYDIKSDLTSKYHARSEGETLFGI